MSHQICPACGLPKFSGVVGYAGPMCQCQWKQIPRWESHTDDLAAAQNRIEQLEASVYGLYELEAERDRLRFALENCRLLAARHRKEDWAIHILRFCSDAGVTSSTMRAQPTKRLFSTWPVAWALWVRRADTEWRQYSLYETKEQAQATMRRVEGPPLELKIVPLYAAEEDEK